MHFAIRLSTCYAVNTYIYVLYTHNESVSTIGPVRQRNIFVTSPPLPIAGLVHTSNSLPGMHILFPYINPFILVRSPTNDSKL